MIAKLLFITLLLLVPAAMTSGCDDDVDSAEDVGEEIDDAVD